MLFCLQVELQVTSVRVVSRAGALPFELMDAARSEVRWQAGRQAEQSQMVAAHLAADTRSTVKQQGGDHMQLLVAVSPHIPQLHASAQACIKQSTAGVQHVA